MSVTTPDTATGLSADLAPRRRRFWAFLLSELKPQGKLLTTFNVISIPVMLAALVIVVLRFAGGLGAVTNLSDAWPWGIWAAVDVIAGVAFAGGAYVLCFMVYILGIKKYAPAVRVTVLASFLAYLFYAGALLLELGRPWNIVNPIIGNNFGLSAVLFLVAWHFLLYMIAALLEFSPAIAEWAGAPRLRRVLQSMTLGAVILGVALSLLHQSGLGALFLMSGPKIHPLWFSEFLPILFLVSSIFAGLSLVIVESAIAKRVFAHVMDAEHKKTHRRISFGLARICAGAMFAYLGMVVITFVHGHDAASLTGGMGAWWLVEILGFTALPGALFVVAIKRRSLTGIRLASVLTLIGVLMNRLNVCVIAYRWDAPNHYVPTWMEVVVTLGIIFAEVWVLRWIILRMPILRKPPAWARADDARRGISSH
ncbi:MAG: hypothetical protein EP329_24760 [Deltaproteobacteria bacterium]|nr:MAG: hypothetical protein EP329_24760 [Deltaproteobacteria bacterium]